VGHTDCYVAYPLRSMKKNNSNSWNTFFSRQESERDSRLGVKSTEYIISKYYQLYQSAFSHEKRLSFLELGAGRGEITQEILKRRPHFLNRYVVTELTASGVKALKHLSIPVKRMDAQRLTFKNSSFDAVVAFDVMHHVPDPRKMGNEMARVAKKHIFLIEANGLSLARKILEQTKWYKTMGENSYFPWQYLSFFPKNVFSKLTIRPFLFVPPNIPDSLGAIIPLVSETLERIPIVNWQCSGVVIHGVKK